MLNIDNQNLCELCFAKLPPKTKKCPYCGSEKNIIKYPTSLPEGTILVGRYAVGKVLGKGGFGITYLCYDLKEKRKVAIKEYLPDTLAHRNSGETAVTTYDGEQEEVFKNGARRFYEEAKLVSRFNGNPNIISVYEFFYSNNTTYFVMEYMSGMDLKRYLKTRNGKISEGEALYIANRAAEALLVVHSTNTLHRDISPDNIFLCENGDVKLIDFGAARHVIAEESQSLSVIIKHGFAPFEQYQRKGKQGPWTDIYALGSTIYLSVSGKMLDDAMSRLDDDEVDSKNISPDLAAVLLKMIAFNKEDRYQDIPELKKDLAALDTEQVAPLMEKQKEKNLCKKCGTEIPEGETICNNCKKSEDNSVKKRNGIILSVCAAVVLLSMTVGLFALGIFGSAPEQVQDEPWSFNDGTLTVFCEGSMVEHGLTGSSSPWYDYSDDITTVIIEGSVTSIEDGAFADYNSLESIIINNIKANISVSDSAFPDNVNVIYTKEIQGVDWLYSDGVLTIFGNGAMDDYKKDEAPWIEFNEEITTVIIEDGVTTIGDYAFYNCFKIRNVTVPDSVTSIGYRSFERCRGLTLITIPNSVLIIGNYAFSDCYGLTVVTIPNSVKSLGDHAFSDCYFLSEIIIENSKKNINISSTAIPRNTKIIYAEWNITNGVLTVSGNSPFEETTVETRPWIRYKNDITSVILADGVTLVAPYEFREFTALTDVTLSKTLSAIEEGMFYGCKNLNNVTVPEKVNLIGKYAFYDCISITEIVIPKTVKTIGYGAFYGCIGLENVTVQNGVEQIDSFAFYQCDSLTSVEIPRSVIMIGASAFNDCENLAVINVDNREENIEIGQNAFKAKIPVIYNE